MQLARLGLFEARAPRYTSYPTAPHFMAGADPALFAQWVRAIPAGSAISLYLHVPFCRRLCWFCACRTQGTSTMAPVAAYAQLLHAELAMLAAHLPPGVTLSRLHWGGGTPTLMPAGMITELARAIFAVVPMGPEAEFSVEIDPAEVDEARMDALVQAGMNRASIGVQDFDPVIQKAIGREQSFDLTARVAKALRRRGVASLNADILYGLPHQTVPGIADSVEKLLSLAPDRVALFGYAHVPWVSRRQVMIPDNTIPSPEARLRLFETARALFVDRGYAGIGTDHFALPTDGLAIAAAEGRLRRNFQGYTDDQAPVLLGVGASSISRFPQGYIQNSSATSAYGKAIAAGQFASARAHVFAGEDQLRGRIIEALMCDFRVDLGSLLDGFGLSDSRRDAIFAPALAAFPGMVAMDGSAFTILPQARPLTRMIAQTFDAYDMPQGKHSLAV